MKKITRILLALALIAAMLLSVGCGSDPAPKATPAPVVDINTGSDTPSGEPEPTVTNAPIVGSVDDSSVSRVEVDDNGWDRLACGGNYTLALTKDGQLTGWGRNSYGQVGYGVVRDTNIIAIQPVLKDTVFFCCGEQNSCGIDKNGVLYLWGANHSGQMGNGNNTGLIDPTISKSYSEEDKIVSFTAGKDVIFALAEDGTLYASGTNANGQISATESVHKTPVVVFEGVASVATNGTFSMVIKTDGSIWVTGKGKRGELGLGADVTEVSTWTQVTSISDVATIALGEEFALALKNDGTVWSVGRNNKGQLGIASEEKNMTDWTQVADGVASIFADAATAGMVKTDGTLWMWGDNSKGQVGNGTDDKTVNAPVQVLDDVKMADCGYTHAAAVRNDGSLWIWGNNYYYELCDGTTTNCNAPKQVVTK